MEADEADEADEAEETGLVDAMTTGAD